MISSLAFPNMIKYHKFQVEDNDYKATLQNMISLLSSEKGQFKFDPYFGIRIKNYMFDQNNYALQDILIDEIYEQLQIFIPQIQVNRGDIYLYTDPSQKGVLFCHIKARNRLTFTLNIYDLVLFDTQGE